MSKILTNTQGQPYMDSQGRALAVDAGIDPNIIPSNIKSGVSILGVSGSYAPALEERSVTPTTSQQTVTPTSGKDGMSRVTVAAVTAAIDSDIKASNIKKGVNILGVEGTLESGGGDTYSVVPDTLTWQHNQYVTIGLDIDAGGNLTVYKASGSGTANNLVVCYPQSSTYRAADEITRIDYPQEEGTYDMPITVWWDNQSGEHADSNNHTISYTVVKSSGARLQAKTATPSTSQQTVSPDTGYDGLSQVTVNAVTSAIDSNIAAGNIRKGVSILGVNGTYEGGAVIKTNLTYKQVNKTSLSASGLSITVDEAGTYKVSWVMWRSSSSGTSSSRVYVNGSAKGTDHTTFVQTYGAQITETNITVSTGQTVEIYARSGSTSRYTLVANLIIEKTN